MTRKSDPYDRLEQYNSVTPFDYDYEFQALFQTYDAVSLEREIIERIKDKGFQTSKREWFRTYRRGQDLHNLILFIETRAERRIR